MWQFHIRHFDSLSCLVIILLFPFQLRERTFPSRFSRAVANNLFIGMFTLSSGEKNHALKCDGAFEILSILSNNLKIMGKWPWSICDWSKRWMRFLDYDIFSNFQIWHLALYFFPSAFRSWQENVPVHLHSQNTISLILKSMLETHHSPWVIAAHTSRQLLQWGSI